MALFYDPRTIAPFIYRNENYSGTLAIMGNDCSGTSTTCQVDSIKSGVPVSGTTASGTIGLGTNVAATNSTVVGVGCATSNTSVVVGQGASTTAAGATAIGQGISNTIASTVLLGTAGDNLVRFEVPGTVTQGVSLVTGVTLNNCQGSITLFSALPNNNAIKFTVTNSRVQATSIILMNVVGESAAAVQPLRAQPASIGAGTFDVVVDTVDALGSAAAPIIQFHVLYPV